MSLAIRGCSIRLWLAWLVVGANAIYWRIGLLHGQIKLVELLVSLLIQAVLFRDKASLQILMQHIFIDRIVIIS